MSIYMKKSLAFLLSLLLGSALYGQDFLGSDFNYEHGSPGWYSPQIYEINWNNDGNTDLLVFDRAVGESMIYLWFQGTYVYSHEESQSLPKFKEWVVVTDADGDGTDDIYSCAVSQSGMFFYRGHRGKDRLTFQREGSIVTSDQTKIKIDPIDIPAIRDISGDGIADILTFDNAGTYVYFYQGIAPTNFTLQDDCWGRFLEPGLNNEIVYTQQDTVCPVTNTLNRNGPHAGSTVFLRDFDSDGDLDLLLGDLSSSQMTLLEMDSLDSTPIVDSVITDYPSPEEKINLGDFPAIFYVDIDHDGDKDMIAAPNRFPRDDVESYWYYENNPVGEDHFNLMTRSLASEIDKDYGSFGTAVWLVSEGSLSGQDCDSEYAVLDGRKRILVIGQTEEGSCCSVRDTIIATYGSKTVSSFSYFPKNVSSPELAEVVYLVGWTDGTIGVIDSAGMISEVGIDVGSNATPVAYEDEQGYIHLLVGEQNGNINEFISLTPHKLEFSSQPNTDFWQGIDTRIPGEYTGESSITMTRHPLQENQYYCLVGAKSGKVVSYLLKDGDLTLIDSLSLGVGAYSRVDGLITHDCSEEYDYQSKLLASSIGGGVMTFQKNIIIDAIDDRENDITLVNIYPNPAEDVLTIASDQVIQSLRIYDQLGRLLVHEEIQSRTHQIRWDQPGVYFVEVIFRDNKQTTYIKVIFR